MFSTVIGWVTGHATDALAYRAGGIAVLGAGWKMGHDGAVKAAQGAVLDKTQAAATVAADVNAASDAELDAKAKEWTR